VNGGIVKVKNGRRFVQSVASHHYIVIQGHHLDNFKLLESVYDIEVEEI
jgi:hypothetical protein